MDIKHEILDYKGRFYFEIDNVQKAEMTYSSAGPDKIIIDHTEVDEDIKGQGVGYKLVDGAVNYARANNKKIMPLCPFARAVFRKKSEAYKDVLF